MFLSLVSFMSSDVRSPDISGISMTLIGNLIIELIPRTIRRVFLLNKGQSFLASFHIKYFYLILSSPWTPPWFPLPIVLKVFLLLWKIKSKQRNKNIKILQNKRKYNKNSTLYVGFSVLYFSLAWTCVYYLNAITASVSRNAY